MLNRDRPSRRDQRREEREVFGRRGSATQYRMRERLFSIGDDFWIEDSQGQRVFKVDGKLLRVRNTLFFEDLQGNQVCKLQERLLTIKDTMVIETPDDGRLATVKKALISPLRDRWTVQVGDGPDLAVRGTVLDYEYTIGEEGRKIAQVSKRWFRIADTYGVQIEPSQNDLLILAITVALDRMAHP